MDAVAQMRMWRGNSAQFIRDHFHVEPDPWQHEACVAWDRGDQRIAFRACKGPGKTAWLAWIGWHFMLLRPHAKVVCTSISGDNLDDGLWTEFAKWQNKSPLLTNAFEWNKQRIVSRDHPETWFASARTWSKSADATQQSNTLAGLHGDYILFLIDEVGGIPESVTTTAEAALSTGIETRMVMAGNPTLCEGPLWVACNRDKRLWTVIEITGDPDDPKRSPRISKQWAREQIEKHGSENPWVLANVFGKFPPASLLGFIGEDRVSAAATREAIANMFDPLILGVDVARFGDDQTVLYPRKGRDAQTHEPIKLRNLDTMQVAARVAQFYAEYKPDAVFIDQGAMGAGVVDRLRQLGVPVIGIDFGSEPDRSQPDQEDIAYFNKRAEMWGNMREWLKGGAIPNDVELRNELTGPRYAFKIKKGRDAIILEPKEDMKKRGLASPDTADALALTFAYPVMPNENAGRFAHGAMRPNRVDSEYDPFNPPSRDTVVREYDPFTVGA